MPEPTRPDVPPSTVVWANQEGFLRSQIQDWLEQVLEEEVTAFSGRGKA